MGKRLALIKIGGLAAAHEPTLKVLFEEMKALRKRHAWVLVHGGGKEVTQVSERFGLTPVFRDGIRLTSPEEMPVVDMVLAGRMNTYLVRTAAACGFRAVGLGGQDGNTLLGTSLEAPEMTDCRTAHPAETDPRLLELLVKHKYLPIVHSTSMDRRGRGLNINADEAALALAIALKAHSLVFLSDVPGVLLDGDPLAHLDARKAHSLIEAGKIAGGMVPKIQSSLAAVRRGLGRVIIGQFQLFGDLELLLDGRKGTQIR